MASSYDTAGCSGGRALRLGLGRGPSARDWALRPGCRLGNSIIGKLPFGKQNLWTQNMIKLSNCWSEKGKQAKINLVKILFKVLDCFYSTKTTFYLNQNLSEFYIKETIYIQILQIYYLWPWISQNLQIYIYTISYLVLLQCELLYRLKNILTFSSKNKKLSIIRKKSEHFLQNLKKFKFRKLENFYWFLKDCYENLKTKLQYVEFENHFFYLANIDYIYRHIG